MRDIENSLVLTFLYVGCIDHVAVACSPGQVVDVKKNDENTQSACVEKSR